MAYILLAVFRDFPIGYSKWRSPCVEFRQEFFNENNFWAKGGILRHVSGTNGARPEDRNTQEFKALRLVAKTSPLKISHEGTTMISRDKFWGLVPLLKWVDHSKGLTPADLIQGLDEGTCSLVCTDLYCFHTVHYLQI